MAAPSEQDIAQANQLRQQQAAARQQAATIKTSSASKQKKLAAAQAKREQFRFKVPYLIVPTLATITWLLEFFDGGLIFGIFTSTIIFMMRICMLLFVSKSVREFLIVQKKAPVVYFAQGVLSYILSIINIDMFMAWWGVIVTIPREGKRIEKEEVIPLQKT